MPYKHHTDACLEAQTRARDARGLDELAHELRLDLRPKGKGRCGPQACAWRKPWSVNSSHNAAVAMC
jgi:hypothetical protein